MKKYLLVLLAFYGLLSVVKAQDECYLQAINGIDSGNGQICINVITPTINPTLGFIVGTTYTIEFATNHSNSSEPNCGRSGIGNCDCERISWDASSNVIIVPADNNYCSSTSYYLTITDGNLATIEVYSEPEPIAQDPSNYCNTNCTLFNTIRINAFSDTPPYTGICSDLCTAIGLQSTGFEGSTERVFSNWTRRVTTLRGQEKTADDNSNDFDFDSFHSLTTVGEYTNILTLPSPWDPFTNSNTQAVVIGDVFESPADPYVASIEQEFFVSENYDPKLDIWFAWVAQNAPLETEENILFKIELFRLYDGGYDENNVPIVAEELLYLYTENEKEHKDQTTASNPALHVRHFWDKKTIDLTPYKLERLKLKISTIDRVDDDVAKDVRAIVDIACSTCCTVTDTDDGNQSLELTPSTGKLTITRPTKLCEDLPSSIKQSKKCTNLTFFYQLVRNEEEPFVVERNNSSFTIDLEEGVYQVRYKEDLSCCWSDFQTVTISGNPERPDFSNDLKDAAISCVPTFQMSNVLAVNVASFNDRQLVDPRDIVTSNRTAVVEELQVTAPKNPFLTGERGIWRTEASYAYVTDRKGYESNEEELNAPKEGGTFDLNMFNWTTQGVVPENWRKVNQVSRYDGYTHEIENRDILGRYSAALYGYDGQLATAVCSNAAYYEIAQEGFDAYNRKDENEEDSNLDYACGYATKGSQGPHGTNNQTYLLCIDPYHDSPVGSHHVEPHNFIAYEVGKKYAFHIGVPKCNNNSGLAGSWFLTPSNSSVRIVYDDTETVVIQILNDDNPTFTLQYSGDGTICGRYYVLPRLRVTLPIKSFTPINTETNFTINNLYENGAKDRNVVLQVLWAQGKKGVVEGYTPGEGQTIEVDASVLAHTIGKQGSFDILPSLSIDATENEYQINEIVRVRLTHRDAKTSWFEIIPNAVYTLPEEWTTKNEQWYGSIRLARNLPFIRANNDDISTYRSLVPTAHTGNVSLAPSEHPIIQEKLLLIPEKEYVFSAWVRVGSAATAQPITYTGVGAQLQFYDNQGQTLLTTPIQITPSGSIVEGWQRIEGRFTVPLRNMFVSVQLLGPIDNVLYDDVRIYPATGMMKSYVYDPSTYLLQAVLDENNYATLYYYDEEQRLYLVQKETREGIYTIQESRSYIKPKED